MKNNKGTYSYSNRHRMHEKRTEHLVITESRNMGRSFWKEIQAYRQTIDELQKENKELKKDKERLDWLIENNATYWVYTRLGIDKAMEEPTQ